MIEQEKLLKPDIYEELKTIEETLNKTGEYLSTRVKPLFAMSLDFMLHYQWIAVEPEAVDQDWGWCPQCQASKQNGHTKDCEVEQLIKALCKELELNYEDTKVPISWKLIKQIASTLEEDSPVEIPKP